ncbi:hypothetical protein BBI17_000317 [Phytophthora kernoviae]|uniref:Uncharacterized protein n=3 Tax=Phytophthora kernoviae TaxID=325452 RepID=A0A421F4D2_9STRA|nr:hypothetical protein G195_004646 [Phytophthora kernoviae 00238/432]KAG2527463.1 hypothetical protein JM18_003792 [Phytophthora kernoviae]RLN21340.1 hypothetical protein BBI17_000317 [Phytophthora kernoviae]
MFATNRAAYNKMVTRSKENCATRVVTGELGPYFRNKKAMERHIQVNDEVRDSAFRDFTKAVKPSLALFFAPKKKDKKATFPELKFKSNFASSGRGMVSSYARRHLSSRIPFGSNDYVKENITRRWTDVVHQGCVYGAEAIDALKSKLALLVNKSKAKGTARVRQQKKTKGGAKSEQQRERHRHVT